MKKRIQVLLCTLALSMLILGQLNAQSLVGLPKEEVVTLVKKEHKEFHRDQSVVNQRFNYLKYVNGLRSRTWILYFDDDDICKTSKLVCDYGEFDKVVDELNASYKKTGDSTWTHKANGLKLKIEITRQEWYFTVRESKR